MVVRRYYIALISSLLILPLYNVCSNPVKEPFNNLIGHWISEDGQRHFYFSKKKRLVITDKSGETLYNVEYHIGVVEKRTGNKIRKKIYMYFSDEVFGKEECWLTFSEDKKRLNSTDFGVLNYVDRNQRP